MVLPHAHQPDTSQKAHGRATPAIVTYAQRPAVNESLWTIIHETGPGGRTSSNLVHHEKEVEVSDIRTAKKTLTLKDNGFVLAKLKVPKNVDFHNPEQVKREYYPLAEELIQKLTGATRVHIFDTTLRFGQLGELKEKSESAKRGAPQRSAHVDYDNISGINRLSELLPDEAERLKKTPFAIVQIWRPLKGPVKSSPLGMIDVQTVERGDMTPYEIRRPERVGRNFAIHYNPNHRWYYAEGINTDEAYVFVCYDSRSDRARFTPHAGFRDLSVDDSKVPQRESVELRSYVFWEDQPEQLIAQGY